MKMKLYTLIVLIGLCWVGKTYAIRITKSGDSTLLISNLKKGEKCTFFYVDNLGNVVPPFEMSLKTSKKILINKPVLLINSANKVPYLIYPNETLFVDKSKNGLIVMTAKNNAIRTKELSFFLELVKTQGYFFGPAQSVAKEISNTKILVTAKLDFNKLAVEALKRYKLRMQYLEANKQFVSAQFFDEVKTLFKYFYLGDLLLVSNIPSVKLDQIPQSYLKEMIALAKEFKCNECVVNLGYQLAVNQYLIFLNRLKHTMPSITDKYAFINQTFEGDTKRFLLFSLLKNSVLKNNSDYQDHFEVFVKQQADSYSAYLTQEYHRKNDKNYELMDADGKLIGWSEILKKHKGNTIYVDFWASWCIPCRKMMPFSHELKNKLAAHKISMLYISCDRSTLEWKTAIKQENLDKAENYIVTDQKANLLKLFKISGIPRYMIIDKNGNVVDENAMKPDHKELLQKLMALQNEIVLIR